MTISTELRKAGPFTGNGATTAFPFSFKVFAATDVAVTVANTQGNESALALGADYAVALNADRDAAPGGTVTLAAPLASGHRLVVSSAVPNLQPTDITNNGGFYPRVIEDALDRHVAQIQQIDEKIGRALKVAVTSPLGDQALPSPVAGMLIGWNESNDGLKNYAPIGGTLLWQQLAAANGSSLVGFQQAGVGAVVRTVQERLCEVISVKDFGAIGDGSHDDSDAIQAAIDFATADVNKRAAVFMPAGYYFIGKAIQLPNFVTVFGEADSGTIIYNQNTNPSTLGQFVNKDPDNFIYVTLKDIQFLGAIRGLDINVTGEVANCRFENCSWALTRDFNVHINKLLQTTVFINCRFANADYGVFVNAWTSNHNNFINCEFLDHAWSSVYMRSSEVNNFIGCRFEAGGAEAHTTIDVTDTRSMKFEGCYFEATHRNLLTETGSCNSISFDNCHFTGANWGTGWNPYTFNSDGIVQFGNNNWGEVGSSGPPKMFLNGMNWNGKYTSGLPQSQLGDTHTNTLYTAFSKQHKKIISKWVAAPASLRIDLLHFNKANNIGESSNMKAMTGKLVLHYFGLTSGGFEQTFVREYLVFVRCSGFSTMGAVITLGTNATIGAATLTVQQKSGATSNDLTIEAVFAGIVPATDIGSVLQWSFEYMHGSVQESDYIEAQIV